MPLKKGSSQSVVSSNIETLVDTWNKDRSIGECPTRERLLDTPVRHAKELDHE